LTLTPFTFSLTEINKRLIDDLVTIKRKKQNKRRKSRKG